MLRRLDHHATLRSLLDRAEWPQDLSERLRENYKYFRERMAGTDPADVYRGIGCLVIVDVRLDPHADDPQLIFESLNSTGVDLSQSYDLKFHSNEVT